MEINYKHSEFGVWHLADTPIKTIPYGALIKWFDLVIQFGFHLGGGEIAWRDGVISAKNLDTDPGLPWKRKTCVLGQNGEAVGISDRTLCDAAGFHFRMSRRRSCSMGKFPRLDLRPFRQMFPAPRRAGSGVRRVAG